MFTGKKARRQLSFWVTLALSAGGTYLPTGTEGALWEMPTAYAANDVTIAPNDTTVSSGISGTSKTGSVTDNHVTVGTAGTANRPIVNYGGATAGGSSTTSATVSGNVLTINNIWVGNGYIHAGLSGAGAVTGNSAEFKAGTAANSFLYGGYLSRTSGTNAVEENSVTLAGGTVNAVVGGSNAGRGAITKNSATVTGGTVNTTVFGGGTLNTSSTGALTENKVTISGGTIGNNAIGAYDHGNGLVSKNAVTVTNGTVNGNFTAGGYAHAGTTGAVKENTATMSGGQVKNLFGGMSFGTGALEKNKVTFSGGTANLLVGGYATGGNAAGNTVEVSGGTVSSMVYGANVTGAGTATGNKVRLTSGTTGGLVGGFTIGMGNATGNTVEIAGGTTSVIAAGSTSGAGSATGNTVTITGGTVTTGVYGGNATGTGATTGNTVNIGDGSTDELAAGTDLTATTLAGGSDAGDVTGNTLNVKARNVAVDKVKNFETYKFFLHANTPQEATMLTIAQDGFGGSTARIDQDIALDGLAEWSEANKNRIFSRVELIKSGVAGALKLSDRDAYIGAADGLERSVTVDDEATENGGTVEATSVYLRMNRFKDGRQNYNGAEAPVMADGESEVYGGVSYHGNKTENNELTVTGTPGGGELYAVYGGKTAGAAGGSENNTVNVELESGKIKNVYGGFIGDEANVADVVGNKVNLKKGEVGIPFSAALYGGYTEGAGTAKDNIVTITGGEAKGFVTGGWAKVAGNATGNRVVLENGKVRQIFGGWAAKKAADNIVSVKNATVTVGVRGAYGKEDTSNNVVTVENSTVRDSVIAAYLESGDVATGNKVRIDGGQVNKDAWGAYGKSGATVTENEVTIKDAAIGDTVFGGHSINAGKASGNTVTIEGSASVGGPVYAGYIQGNGEASNNKLRIKGGTFAKNVYGGYSLFNGKVENNEVTITGGAFSGDVYGGRADGSLGQATGNIVNLGDGTAATLAAGTNLANTTVYGGSRGGNGNTLNVKAKDVTIKTAKNFAAYKFHLTDDIAQNGTGSGAMLTLTAADGFGGTEGWSKIDVDMSGLSSGQEIIGRTTLLRSTTANALSFSAYDGKDRTHGVVNGDYETALRTDTNTGTATSVILDYNRFQNNTDAVYDGTKDAYTMPHSDGSTTSELFAGISYAGNTTKNNHLKITNLKGDVDAAYGGKTASRQGASTGNSVTVTGTGAHALKNVYGGYTGHALSRGPVTGNTVTFVGGRITGDIYGGYSAGSGITTGNTVNLGDGESDWDAASEIAGTVFGGSDAARITGNTLAVKTKNAAVNKVKNFEKYEFHLKENVADGDTMLTIAQDGFGGRTARLDTDITLDADKLAAWSEANKSNIFTRVELIKSGVTGALKLSGREVYNGASDGLERALLADDSAVLNNGTVEATSLYLRMNRFKDGRHAYDGSKAPVTEGSAKEVYGGISYYGNKTENNELTVTGTQGGGTLDAAYAGKTAGTAGGSENNTVNVELENGKITDVYGGFIKDAANGAVVTGNHVNMKKGEAKNLSGGYTSGTGDVTKNDVTVTDGTVTGDVRGGHTAGAGNVSENEIRITGGTVTGDVSGGYTAGTGDVTKNDARITGGSVTGDVRGGYTTGAGNVSENDVAVTGGTVTGNVYGGYTTGTGATTGNTVNLGDGVAATLAAGTDLSGVTLYGGSNAGDVTGNTLNVKAKDINVKALRNFDALHFHLGDKIGMGSTMLTLTDNDGLGRAMDWSKIRVDASALSADQTEGKLTLLKGASVMNVTGYTGPMDHTPAGDSGDYELSLHTDTGTGAAQEVLLDYNRFRNAKKKYDGSTPATNGEVYGGISYFGRTTANNELEITGTPTGGLETVYGGKTTGTPRTPADYPTKDSKENKVTVEKDVTGEIKNVIGGATFVADGTAEGNAATVRGGKIGSVHGGLAVGASGSAKGNKVFIEGGEFKANGAVIGGGGRDASVTGDMSGNEITVTGGRMNSNNWLVGGNAWGTTSQSNNNVINLGDEAGNFNADLEGLSIWGSSYRVPTQQGGTQYDSFVYDGGDEKIAGNTLNVNAKIGKIRKIRNIDKLNFRLNNGVENGETLLELMEAGGFDKVTDPVTMNPSGQDASIKWDNVTATVDDEKLETLQGANTLTLLKSPAQDLHFTGAAGHARTHFTEKYETALYTEGNSDVTRALLFDVNRFKDGQVAYDGTKPLDEVVGGISRFGKTTEENNLVVKGVQARGILAAYGGKTEGAEGGSLNNRLLLESESENSIRDLYGGYVGNARNNGAVKNNKVTLRKGKVTRDVYGGFAAGAGEASNNAVDVQIDVEGSVVGGHSAGGEANENNLEISAVRIGGDVIGGRGGQGKQTRGNTIRLAGTQIAGEIKGGTGGSEGNTLEILAPGTTANDFSGIENLNFYLSETAGPATPTLLRLNAQQKDIRGLKVGVGFSGAAPVLAPNDAVSLMKIAENGTLTTDENIKNELEGKQGVSMTYKLLLERRGTDELIARVAGAKFNEGTKSLAETRVASHDFYNSGTNMLSHAGVSSAAKAAGAAGVSQEGKNDKYALWAVQGGTNIRAKTGSYVETRGYNLSLGFARQDAVQDGKFTFSPFVEYGRGSYDSYLDDGTHGEGKTSYIGGGLLGRQDMENGSYIEGSLRAGRIKSDYTGNIAGTDTSYDISSSYFGFHLGIGREIKLKGGSSLDTYLKYFYSRQNDASATLTTGERYLFDAVTSSRLRLGLRYTKGDSPESQVYAGIAWEHEFDGEARATYQGMSTPSPSLKGSSAVFELGARFAPKDSNVSYELNLNGWAGKRRGIFGGVQVNWAF